jgi:hypothetical protein
MVEHSGSGYEQQEMMDETRDPFGGTKVLNMLLS